MIRIFIALALIGCTHAAPAPLVAPYTPVKVEPVAPPPAPPPPPPVNLVCERFAKVNPAAKCEAIFTAFGALAAHTALVTLGESQVHCRYDASMTGILCTDSIAVVMKPPPATQDAKPPTKKAPKK